MYARFLGENIGSNMQQALIIFAIALGVVVVYVAVLPLIHVASTSQPIINLTKYGNGVGFLITASPNVPIGTQSLIGRYTSLQAYVSTSNNSSARWVNVSNGGAINLTSLTNSSLFVGSVNASEYSHITQIRLGMRSAQITIYNVTHTYVESNYTTWPIFGNSSIGRNSSVVISLNPVVLNTRYANTTRFVVQPSVVAHVIGNSNTYTKANMVELNSLASNEYSACKGAGIITLVPKKPVVWRNYLGINTQLLWFTPEIYVKQLEALKALGLSWVRIDLHWNYLEPSYGNYSLSSMDTMVSILKQMNISADIYLLGSTPFDTSAPPGTANENSYPPKNYNDFAAFMAMLARRYPSIQAWEIWNEPNLPSFWPPQENATAYGKLFEISTEEIRAAVPGKTIVMGGMAYYSQMPTHNNTLMLEVLGKEGAFQLNTTVAYHPYSEYPEGNSPCNQSFIQHATLLNAELHGAGVSSIWADEWGWSSYNGIPEGQAIIGQTGQAEYLLRRLAMISTMDYNRTFLFTMSNLDGRATLRDRSYGLLNITGSPKLAYIALRRFLSFLGPEIVPTAPINVTTSVPTLYSITWERLNGSRVWIFWGSSDGNSTALLPGGTLYDPLNGNTSTLISNSKGMINVPVRTYLQMLSVNK
jgi:beta-xylosidase